MRAFVISCGALLVLASLNAAELPAEVTRYYGMLRNRPQFGVMFDRFTDAWFVSGTTDGLREFLSAKAGAPDATAQDHLLLALFHTRQGNEVEALAAFTKALAMAPDNAEGWQERARLEMRMLDFTAALKSLDAALAQHPEEKMAVDLAKLRGRVLLRTDKPDDALKAWRDLLKAHPDDEDLAEEVADLQLDEGLTMEAATTMQALIERTKDAYARVGRKLRLADILVRAGKKDDALTQLGECLAQSGRDTWIEGEVLAQIERIFRREDNVSGLAAHLEKLGAVGESSRVAVQHQLARVQAEMGQRDKALATYAALLAGTPGRRDLRESYLDLLERFEKFSDAIAQTKLLIEQNAGDKELQLRLAALQQHTGNAKAADEAMSAYLSAKGTTEYDHLRVARTLEQWGRKADAKAAFARMVATFPQSTSAREAQAHFLHRTGDKEEALAIWRALAEKGGLEQVLSVAQALLTRAEPRAALEVLRARQGEFGKETRFLTPLVTAAIAVNEHALAVPWVLERLRLTSETAMLDDAIRQVMDVLEGAKAIESTMEKLKALPSPPLPERALLAALLEKWGNGVDAEKLLHEAPPEQAVAAQARLVQLVESRKDWPRAATEMEKLMAMPEGRTSQHAQRLVDFRQRAGEPEAALKLIADWKTLSPGAAQPWLTEAMLLSQLSKRQESIQVLRAAARKFEDDDNVVVALAGAYADGGQFADAEQIFLKLVEKSESLDEKLRWVAGLSQMAYSRGTVKAVVEKFQERQRTNHADAAPWLALAEIHKVSNNKTEQRACLAEALRLRPKDVALMQEIARVDEDNADWKSALRMLEQASALDATPRTKQLIAVLQLRWGDENAAFRSLIELFGGTQMEAKDAIKLADAMMAREEWKRAAELLEPLVQRTPGDYRLRYLRAIALNEDGNRAGALEEFFRVATTSGELPEVLKRRPAGATAGLASVIAKSEKDYPPGTRQFMDIMQSGYGALQHLYRRQMSGVVSSMGGASVIQLPTTVEQAHNYAMVHLVSLMREEKSEAIARMKQELRNGGYTDVDSLLTLEPKPQSAWNMAIPEEALKSRPNDAVLHAAWLMTTGLMRRDQPVVDASLCQRAFDLFKDEYPRLALYAASSAMRTEPAMGVPMVEALVRKLEAGKDARDDEYGQSTYLLSSFLGGGQRIDITMRTDLPEALRKRICQLLLDGAKLTDDGASYTVAYCANGLRAEGDWARYVKLWDSVFAAYHQADPAKRKAWAAPPRIYSSSQSKPLLAPLEFPPACGSMPTTFAMLMRYEDPVNTHIEQWHRPGPEPDYAPVAKMLDTVKDPVLRLVLAYKSDQKAVVESELSARLALPQPSADDVLLAASYSSCNNDYARAAALLVRCTAMPLEAAQRVNVDAALVHAVTNLPEADRQKLPAASLLCAQQAARRLRAGQLSIAQRDELTSALASLGRKEEAEQWRRIAALTPPPPSTGPRTSSSTSSSSSSNVRIQKLVTQGDLEGAVRLAVASLRAILAQYGPNNDASAKRAGTTVALSLSFPDARKKLLAAIDPGAGASDAKLMEAGRMLEIIEEPDKARDLYTAIVDRNPNHQDARVRTMILTITRNPAQAVAMLDGTSWRDMAKGIGDQLAATLRNSEKAPFTARMRMLLEMANYLEKLGTSPDRPQRGSLEWARALVDAAAAYDNSARLPTLYEKRLDSNSYYRTAVEADLKLRREVHDALCYALLKHPSVADSGFRALAGLAISEGRPTAELVPVAEKILRDQAEEISSGPAFPSFSSQNRYIENPARNIWRPSPEEFLMWQAWKEGKMDRISSEILPLAERCAKGPELRTLRASSQLWLSDPAGFAEAASAYARTVNASSTNPYGSRAEIDVIERWAARKLPTEVIEPFLITQMKQNRGASFSFDGGMLMVYLLERAARMDTTGLDDFITRLGTALLGPESGWQKRIAPLLANRNAMYSSNGDQTAAMLISTANNLTRKADGFAIGLRLAGRLGLLDNASWRSSYLTSNSLEAAQRADTVVAFLTLAPFVEEAASFQPWSTDATGERPTLLEQFFSNARKSVLTRDAIRAHLAQQPRTFGVEFCEAMLPDNPAPTLSAMLKRRAADIIRLPEARQAEMNAMLIRLIPALKQPATLDPALKEALAPLMAARFKEQQDRVDTWLKARLTSDLRLDDSDYEAELIHTLVDLTMRDRAKAREFFLHACDLMERKEVQQGWTSGNCGNGWLLRSYVLEEAMQQLPKMEALGLCMQLCHEDTTSKLTMSGWSNTLKWGAAMMETWKTAGGQGSNASGLEALVARTQKELGDTPPTLLALAFYDFFAKLPPSLRVPALKWAEKPPQDAALAPIMKELAMAGRFFLGTDGTSRANAGAQKALQELGGLAPVWEHALAQMKDEKISPRVRLALGHHYCYRAPLAVTPEIANQAAALALQAMKEGHCIHGYQHAWIMRAFCRLPVDDAWKEAAQQHWEAWIARTSAKSGSRSLRYDPCDWALHNMILLAGRADRPEWIARISSEHALTLSNEPSELSVLVAAGRPKEAVSWLKENWKESTHDYESGLLWSTEVAAGLPAFREACGSPDLALLGDIMLALLPDPPKPDQASVPGFQDRTTRLTALAEKLRGTNFADDGMRTRCLACLAQEYQTYGILAKEYDEAAGKADVTATAALGYTTNRALDLKPVRASISRKAWEGDMQPAIQAYDKALAAKNASRSAQRTAIKEVGSDPLLAVPYKLARTEKADWRPLLAFVDHVLARTPTEFYDSHIADAVSLKLIIHLANGQTDAVAKWRKELTVDQTQAMQRQFEDRFELGNFVRDYCGVPKPHVPVEGRVALVSALLDDEWVKRRYPEAGGTASSLATTLVTKSRIFTPDEFVIAWKPIAEALPRKGRTAADAADFFVQNNKLPAALLAFDFAAAQTEKDLAASNGFRFRKAEILERMNRKEEARVLLEALDGKKLGPAVRGQYQTMLKRLGAKQAI